MKEIEEFLLSKKRKYVFIRTLGVERITVSEADADEIYQLLKLSEKHGCKVALQGVLSFSKEISPKL